MPSGVGCAAVGLMNFQQNYVGARFRDDLSGDLGGEIGWEEAKDVGKFGLALFRGGVGSKAA